MDIVRLTGRDVNLDEKSTLWFNLRWLVILQPFLRKTGNPKKDERQNRDILCAAINHN